MKVEDKRLDMPVVNIEVDEEDSAHSDLGDRVHHGGREGRGAEVHDAEMGVRDRDEQTQN